MNEFNLDINNYSCKELVELLSIPDDYDKDILYNAKTELGKKLINLNDTDSDKISDILLFLDNAYNKLLEHDHRINIEGTYKEINNHITLAGSNVIIKSNNEIEGKKLI